MVCNSVMTVIMVAMVTSGEAHPVGQMAERGVSEDGGARKVQFASL